MADAAERLLVTRVGPAGRIARVTINRPDIRNAIDGALVAELHAAFERLGTEPAEALRGVVLGGAGTTFCAGADAAWLLEAGALPEAENLAEAERLRAMLLAIEECPVPVVVRVQGAALGGGMGLCAASDLVLSTADATFGFTETRLGVMPAVISPFVLSKIGETHARALFPGGTRFGAERAMRIGLVHEVLAGETALDRRIDEVLGELMAAGPHALRAAKAIVRDQRGLRWGDAGALTVTRIAAQRSTPEAQEGLAAFLGKRTPAWQEDRTAD